MELVLEQLTSRDAALLTWMGVGLIAVVWSLLRGGEIGRDALSVVCAFLAPRILGTVALVAAWLVLTVYLAAHLSLWNFQLLKDTVVIISAGAFLTGFKALAVANGKETMRDEVAAVVAFSAVIQFIANLQTFPYLVELTVVPVAATLGGMQVLANHNEGYKPARPVINGMIALLGACVIAWSVYKIVTSLGSADWQTLGKSFALAFWLPAALLPAVYAVALTMQYGKTLSMMGRLQPISIGARLDLCAHFGTDLARLGTFSRTPGRVLEYARAESRHERLAVLHETTQPKP